MREMKKLCLSAIAAFSAPEAYQMQAIHYFRGSDQKDVKAASAKDRSKVKAARKQKHRK
jgi:hypothetical protein